jgi:hypothetical protein
MRINADANRKDLKTVKAQGQRVARAWREQTGIQVDVKAIKRTHGTSDSAFGFVVLESYTRTYLCHYDFEADRLSVRNEYSLKTLLPKYLGCPENLLAMAEPENNYWRQCTRAYMAFDESSPDRFAGNVTLFLLNRVERRDYSEPFHVLQKREGEWFGIDCYGEAKYLQISISDIREHCPVFIDMSALKPYDQTGLAYDCVNTGQVIYKVDGEQATLLGRTMTRLEQIEDRCNFLTIRQFELHPENPVW